MSAHTLIRNAETIAEANSIYYAATQHLGYSVALWETLNETVLLLRG